MASNNVILPSKLIIGIDVGGTFTDVTVWDKGTGLTAAFKVLSNRTAPDQAILQGLQKAAVNLSDVERIVHGTTVATNVVLERRGPPIAMITTTGFRDVVELGRTTRMVPNTLYDPYFRKPPALVKRRDRYCVDGRIEADGSISATLDETALHRLGASIAADGVEAVAICLFNSYRNPVHEIRAATIISEYVELVSVSHEVLNEIREYERFSTCVVNAYIMPVMVRYVQRLVGALNSQQYQGAFYTMGSNGGLLSNRMVETKPVRTILSGPAGGVAASCALMGDLGIENFISYDMGGTSSDVSLVCGGRWPQKRETIIDAIIIKVPQIDINTIGAGGGSIAYLDEGGSLLLGPESAGSHPGPACYGNGGLKPTLTDANAVLRRLGGNQTLGATLAIDAGLADAVLQPLAKQKGVTVQEMANGVVGLAVAKAAAAIYEVSVARGHDPRQFTLVPFGGAGPLHACQVAQELGIDHVCVPCNPGVFSSFGSLCTAVSKDRSRTLLKLLDKSLLDEIRCVAQIFEQEIRAEIEGEGLDTEGYRSTCQLDARYLGQAHEITITVTSEAALGDVEEIFCQEFAREFGRLDQDRSIEIVNVRIIGHLPVNRPAFQEIRQGGGAHAVDFRELYFNGGWSNCPVYDRTELLQGDWLAGPAIVEEMSATLYVPLGWTLTVGRLGELNIRYAQ